MMHFIKHEWHRRKFFLILWVMVAMAKKVGIDYLSVQEFIVSWNSFPLIFLGGRNWKIFKKV